VRVLRAVERLRSFVVVYTVELAGQQWFVGFDLMLQYCEVRVGHIVIPHEPGADAVAQTFFRRSKIQDCESYTKLRRKHTEFVALYSLQKGCVNDHAVSDLHHNPGLNEQPRIGQLGRVCRVQTAGNGRLRAARESIWRDVSSPRANTRSANASCGNSRILTAYSMIFPPPTRGASGVPLIGTTSR